MNRCLFIEKKKTTADDREHFTSMVDRDNRNGPTLN